MSAAAFSHVRRTTTSRLEIAAATSIGRRPTNADAYLVDEAAGLFAVADGLGDTPRSGVVARIALDAVREMFDDPWRAHTERVLGDAAYRLRLGITQAHRQLYAPARPRASRVGTTFAGVVVCGDRICAAHVGDSRVYLLHRSKGRLVRTIDHTVAGDARRGGKPRDFATALPNASTVTRMIGVSDHVPVEPTHWRWGPDDMLLICTDGVSDNVGSTELATILLDAGDLDDAARRIVARASEAGGWDNATALLLRKRR